MLTRMVNLCQTNIKVIQGKRFLKKPAKVYLSNIKASHDYSPEEFIELRNSNLPVEYSRTEMEGAPITVWYELIEKYPEMKVWVARNRTTPREIIDCLSKDSDPLVRNAIC